MQSTRFARHRALRREARDDASLPLEERDPSLLNLPVTLPSIPILNPIVTALVGGPDTTTTTATTTATTTTTATADSTPTGGSGSGSGGNSGSSSSGSGSGDSGSSSGDSGDSGNSGSSSGNSGGSSNGSSGGSSGADPAGGSSDTSSSTKDSSGTATSANPSGGAAGATGGKGSSTAPGGIFAAHTDSPVGNVGDSPTGALPTGPTSVVTANGKTMTVIGSVTYTNGVPTLTGSTAQTTGSSGGGSGSGATSTGSGSKHSAPVGAIAGVLGALSLIALVVFVVRRRAVAKRAARKRFWSSVVAPGDSNAWDRRNRDSGDATAGDSATTRSIRSSFGTTFDHSEFSITFDDNVPELPPMVEIRGGPSSVPKGDSSMAGNGQPLSPISPISPTAPQLPMPLLVNIENSNLFSDANRRASAGSSTSAQYLTVDRESGATNHQLATPEASTPMSVRPFSPSEAFAFPAPPREARSGEATPTVNQTLVPAPTARARYIENPFADAFSVPDTPTAPSAQFDAVETIWRPFEQTLQDEITVNVADQVKVLAVYDDGWAMIERISAGRGKTVGLIPIDCMRKGEESVSSFLAAKRVSSVDATGYLAMAV